MAKFWHYTAWGESTDDGSKIDLDQELADKVFSQDLNEIAEGKSEHKLDQSDTKSYYLQFQMIKADQYHGRLFRVKDEDAFFRRTEDNQIVTELSEETEGDGEAGARDSDTAEFAVIRRNERFHILLERGFQTPGISILLPHFAQHIETNDEFTMEKETRMGPDAEERLRNIMGEDMKSIEVSFKKNPSTYSNLSLDDALDTMTEDEYKFSFSMSLERGGTVTKDTEQGVSKVISMITPNNQPSNQPVTNSIRQLDIPKMMSKFTIEARNGNREIEENLADTIKREEISKTGYGFFDSALGERLCKLIEDQI